ncbi:uncharacterized protein [Antedon mediterranea]|uniref:uncharacterized protein n=1 Tax=Antedon mediterranea TaxID=105859 RepID=UPI003AF5D93A
MHAILHIVTVVCCLFKTTQTSSEVLDITTLATSLASDTQNEARGLIVKGNMTTNASIGILYKDAKQNVSWADTGHLGDFNDTTGYLTLDMPDDRIFSTTSKVTYSVHEDFMYLGVKSLPFGQRVGVFSFEASKDDVHTRSAVVVTELHGTITMKSRTQTVGVGESVTISLDRGRYLYSLQWRHNYGDPVTRWYSETSITLSNIRAKDGGVYECYKYETGRHGIMRLIVRGCPSPKWNPPDCEEDCPVCYNGGVCDDKTGVCICPAGFTGEHCETACELHNWGRTCALGCTSGSNPTCMGVHFCPPDPVGCSCYRGYSGNDCHTACTYKQYGADCLQTCHCSSNDCDNGKGCRENVTCSDYYTGPGCQERKLDRSCPYGTFGLLCNYPCHCKSDAPCNRDGSCDAGCHEAWAGHDCSIECF